MSRSLARRCGILLLAVNLGTSVQAQSPDAPGTAAPDITITGEKERTAASSFPATSAEITENQLQATVNNVDVEDAAKYLPSLFVRKRNYGDTQPVLATRTWGVNSSARTLIYVDDIPISALIANNNTIGAPRWGVVSPEQVSRVEMLYGPFSAEYPGNSMGGVMRISTRTPQATQITLKQTQALQSFDAYETRDSFLTSQTSATAGGRVGELSWFFGGNFQDSSSQPLSLITAPSVPPQSSGTILAKNKLGQAANVLGAGGLLHTRMANVTGKVGYELTPAIQASYLFAYWRNLSRSGVSSYLRDAAGLPTFARNAGFASSRYELLEEHLMQALTLKSETGGNWNGEVVATYYDFLTDRQLSPAGVGAGTTYVTNGRLADLGGTNWGTVDLKGYWRPGTTGKHEVSGGAHLDRYTLHNPTYNTTDWQDLQTRGSLFSSGRGRTATQALWLQDVWKIEPGWQATFGGRYEHWQASDGFNLAGAVAVAQPEVSATSFSPKLSVGWQAIDAWTLTLSLASATRFPTVAELYQLVSTGSTFTAPNAALHPEKVRSGELAIQHTDAAGYIRGALFQDNTRDALISQSSTLPPVAVPVTYFVNVGEIRNRGVELAARQADLFARGFEVSGSVTFVDSRILSNDNFASTTGTRAQGARAPYVPRWRATLVTTYRPVPSLAFTLAGRYSGHMYSTVDNIDNTPNVYGAFDSFTVIDARAHWDVNAMLSVSAGVDNLNDRNYFLFHPFPRRTYVADLRLKF